MNIKDPLDISLVNALSSRLIHAKVLSWTFIYVTCVLHVLHVLDDSGFAYEQPSELSSERFDQLSDQHSELTFWTSELVYEFNVLWFLVSWYGLNFVCVLVNNSRTHKYQKLSKSINPLITIDVVTPVLIVSRILNTFVKTDTGYINHTIQKTT